jgi:membrane-bound serine protease (ClpP class)
VRIGAPSVPGEKDGKPQTPDAMERKLVNDSVAWIRSLADIQGRNADWAEKAVREGVSLPAREAQEQKVVELLAIDIPSLLEQAEGRIMSVKGSPIVWTGADAKVEAFDPDWRNRLLAAITDPTIAYVLLLVGVYGLIFEALAPGSFLPGTVGAISLIVAIYALNLMSVDAAGALLIALGIALMIGEAVTPTLGVLGFAGAAAFAVGSVFLFSGNIPEFTLSPWLIAAATAMSAGVMAWAVTAGVRATRHPLVSGEADYEAGRGEIIEWQAGEGLVRFHSELWQARGPVDLAPGAMVRIQGRDGLTLVVEGAAKHGAKP